MRRPSALILAAFAALPAGTLLAANPPAANAPAMPALITSTTPQRSDSRLVAAAKAATRARLAITQHVVVDANHLLLAPRDSSYTAPNPNAGKPNTGGGEGRSWATGNPLNGETANAREKSAREQAASREAARQDSLRKEQSYLKGQHEDEYTPEVDEDKAPARLSTIPREMAQPPVTPPPVVMPPPPTE